MKYYYLDSGGGMTRLDETAFMAKRAEITKIYGAGYALKCPWLGVDCWTLLDTASVRHISVNPGYSQRLASVSAAAIADIRDYVLKNGATTIDLLSPARLRLELKLHDEYTLINGAHALLEDPRVLAQVADALNMQQSPIVEKPLPVPTEVPNIRLPYKDDG